MTNLTRSQILSIWQESHMQLVTSLSYEENQRIKIYTCRNSITIFTTIQILFNKSMYNMLLNIDIFCIASKTSLAFSDNLKVNEKNLMPSIDNN